MAPVGLRVVLSTEEGIPGALSCNHMFSVVLELGRSYGFFDEGVLAIFNAGSYFRTKAGEK